jgi:LysM repeat protein
MSGQKYLIILFLIPVFFYACRSSRPVVTPSGGEANASAYIERYTDLAISEMKRTGIPASITLAQGMIESDFGRSTLARKANNHFGIKCHSDWTGPVIRHHDDRRNECFRKYSRPEDSFYDHSDFLIYGSRYSFLFDIPVTDYKAWARGLKKAGYATNPDYANMLIRKIEESSLYIYDRGYSETAQKERRLSQADEEKENTFNGGEVFENPYGNENQAVVFAPQRILENNRIKYIIVQDGETREMIEKEFQLLRWELSRYNELSSDFTPAAGQILYLQPKRDRAEPGKEIHIVSEGDTMYSISQQYGIKLQKLYELNRMMEGEETAAGVKIRLRSIKPVN